MVSQDSETVDSPAAIAGAGPAKGKDRSDLLVLLGLATCVGLAMVTMLNIEPGDPCERDMLTECTQLSVARWHENGDREALARMISSCEWYVPACQHLSEIASDLEAGTHGPRDLETASKLYRIACDSKFEQHAACVEYARLQGTGGLANPDLDAARVSLKKACVARLETGCDALARLDAVQP